MGLKIAFLYIVVDLLKFLPFKEKSYAKRYI